MERLPLPDVSAVTKKNEARFLLHSLPSKHGFNLDPKSVNRNACERTFRQGVQDLNKIMPIRDNEIHCTKCDKKIDYPHVVRYKGEDFHAGCFNQEAEKVTDIKRNPHLKMTLEPKTVKTILEAMECFLDSNSGSAEKDADLHKRAKKAYSNVAIRLAQAGQGIAQCSHCERARYYKEMVKGGESKKKIEAALNQLLTFLSVKLVREKIKSEQARVLLFCNTECDKAFSARNFKERITGYDEIHNLLAQKLTDPASAAKETVAKAKAAKEKAARKKALAKREEQTKKLKETMRFKSCAVCNKKHVNYECDECGAWLGRGSCAQKHQKAHDEEAEAEALRFETEKEVEEVKVKEAAAQAGKLADLETKSEGRRL